MLDSLLPRLLFLLPFRELRPHGRRQIPNSWCVVLGVALLRRGGLRRGVVVLGAPTLRLLLEDSAHARRLLELRRGRVHAKPVVAVQQPAEAVIGRVELETRTTFLPEQRVALALALALELRLRGELLRAHESRGVIVAVVVRLVVVNAWLRGRFP